MRCFRIEGMGYGNPMLVAPAVANRLSTRSLRGSMLTTCVVPGCGTLTLGGGTCVAHDVPVKSVFPRGRPYFPAAARKELALVSDE